MAAIRSELLKTARVEAVDLDWVVDDDIPPLRHADHITARIRVAGQGELVLCDLSEDSVRDAKHLCLVSVGPYRTRYRGEGLIGAYEKSTGAAVRSEFAGGAVDIGPEGEFASLFPFEIPNAQAAVAHYEDILGVIASWPETPSAPRHFTSARGTEFFYWVATRGEHEDDPLWMQPLAALRASVTRAK